MDGDYLEKEVLEISAFLQLLRNVNYKDMDELDVQTALAMISEKADNLYCYIADQLTKEIKGRA